MSDIIISANSKVRPLPGLKHSYSIADLKVLLGYDDSKELERTPGAVAVSRYTAGDRQGQEKPLPVSPEQTHSHDKNDSSLSKTCADAAWVTLAQCQKEKDKFFAKRIYCGKEWCPVCGQKRSRHHNRKIARVLPKAMQIESMGYFVIEFPDKYRKDVTLAYSKKGLQQFTNKIVEVLAGRRQGRRGRVGGLFSRGLIRWHWFGDKHADGDRNKWNPHLNVLVDAGYIEKEQLEEIKATIRQGIGIPDLIIHYSFANEPGKMFQRVEYITRATFRNIKWNEYMAYQLYGFRNQRWFGNWKGEAVWHVDPNEERELLAADALEGGHCPDCGGDLVWTKPLHAGYLNTWKAVEIGQTGFYRLPVQEFAGHVLSPGEVMRLHYRFETKKANILMRVRDKRTAFEEVLAYIDTFEDIDDNEEIPGELIGREVQGEIYLN